MVQPMSAWLVKTRRAPSRHSINRDARDYGHTTMAMHKLRTLPPPLRVSARKRRENKKSVVLCTCKRISRPLGKAAVGGVLDAIGVAATEDRTRQADLVSTRWRWSKGIPSNRSPAPPTTLPAAEAPLSRTHATMIEVYLFLAKMVSE